jgi:hypothetical protein
MREFDAVTCTKTALDTFQIGVTALHHAQEGDQHAAEEAVTYLRRSLEFVTEESYLDLWIEIHLALADAYAIRAAGDPLENARLANAYYQAALRYK